MMHSPCTAEGKPTRLSRLMKLYHLFASADILNATTVDIRNGTGITATLNGPQGPGLEIIKSPFGD